MENRLPRRFDLLHASRRSDPTSDGIFGTDIVIRPRASPGRTISCSDIKIQPKPCYHNKGWAGMWTEQTVETLRDIRKRGKKRGLDRRGAGRPSRNAVIGKANRIGIRLRLRLATTNVANGSRSGLCFDEPPGCRHSHG